MKNDNSTESSNECKPMLANRLSFRAWSDELKSMSKPFTFGQVLNFNDKTIKSLTNENVLRFVGLKDENGLNICEGDIVKVTHINYKGSDKEYIDGIYISEVFYSDYQCFFGYTLYEESDLYVFNSRSMVIEVIGNVFENKELLQTMS